MIKMKKYFFVFFLGFSLFLFPAKKDELDAINKQIENIKYKLNNLKKEKRSILNDIYEIELKYLMKFTFSSHFYHIKAKASNKAPSNSEIFPTRDVSITILLRSI